ncbi:hypothetical protein JAAARDRAFT_118513 [Jaapia argillacea MUCL 33604]|uniref:SNF2 N-terminal domain-containing protein n=1 Tax=Jaapia argillacea MUCL 33604 TaxID=933084 RepID=A0A067QMM8_9AGAM|nr:hypothetical protein JAAARDRAFT_118513 [Jaapia argillacea MUCL 33604]
MLWETIANLDDVDKEIPDFSLNEEPCFDWSDGVGVELGRKTTDELWAMLGLSEKKIIPGFNAFIDPSGRTPKTHKEWFQSADETELEPLRLKWHQLIALVTLLFRAFEGKPMLLMDDVGVGKTIQILALFATIAYFHDHRIKHGKFPGVFRDDFVRLFALDKRNPSVVPKPKHGDVVFQKNRADTIWRADYNFVAIDEIHVTRNNNEKYFAAMALGKVTHCKIGLTATPITTRPQVSLVGTSLVPDVRS